MKIQKIELFHIAIPLSVIFETSFGRIEKRPALIIKMTADDGAVGYGESSPLYVPMSEPEIVDTSIELLRRELPEFVGFQVSSETDICSLYKDQQHPVSRIGIEGAYLDLVAQSQGKPMYRLFGSERADVIVGESVGIQESVEALIKKIQQYVDAGFSRIKIKITPGKDIEYVRAARHAFPSLNLGVDANAAYTSKDISHLAQLKEYNLAFIEQPFSADDYSSHTQLRKEGIPICLDETVRNLATCKLAVEEKACDVVNIKPARIGSYSESLRIHDYCVANGIRLFGGGRMETGIGKSMNAHFYSLPGFTDASDLTPPLEYFIEDIITPSFEVHSGTHKLSSDNGIGIEVNEKTLARYCVEQFCFE